MLLEPPGDEGGIENYRICEINARFCWNGYMYTTFGQQALLDMGVGKNGLEGIAVPEDVSILFWLHGEKWVVADFLDYEWVE